MRRKSKKTTTVKISPVEKNDFKNEIVEQSVIYEKKIYDLEQMLDIAKSFCSTLNFKNLLESITYICMAQMHVLGAEIFVRDLVSSDSFTLETSEIGPDIVTKIPATSPLVSKLLELKKPVTFEYLKDVIDDKPVMDLLERFQPTLVVPLVQNNHLNGILILLERIAIENDTSYTEYEQNQIKSIALLASLAINNASLIEKSSTDMMTHLKLKYFFLNALTETIDAAFAQNNNVAVLMFDIDFFKKFNDTYGHECGDYVLTSVANIIKSNLREVDVAARYGGEEFTVLLNEAGKEEAMLVAERIRSKIENYDFVYEGQHLHVTISGGVSVFDTETNPITSPKNLVNQADMGLYMSKRNGRNQVTFFEPEDILAENLEEDV
ncbi:MAG: sensor domain-containing diguanylate cyclase [Treponema sp.]|nr:sensor domain-containing diguanylate cyclase [Treponema sp.]